jgi:hypothetical protein
MSLIKKKSEENTPEETTTTPVTTTEKTSTPVVKEKSTTDVAVHSAPSAFITNPLFLEAVADASYGTFPSVVASNGSHETAGSDSTDLGKVIKFQVIVTKDVYKVAPGSNDEEAKEYFKVGDTEEELEEDLQDALDAGFSKAAIKKYIDVICVVVDCKAEEFINETITLQLAPSSQFTWRPLEGKCKMAAAMGKLKAEPVCGNPDLGSAVVFTSTAKGTEWKGNKFTKFEFSI